MAGILGIYGMIVAVIIVQRSIFRVIQLEIPILRSQAMPIWPQDYAAALVHW